MNRDGEIVITAGVPIGLAVTAIGFATTTPELTLTGVGFAASAVLIGGLFAYADPDTEETW